MILISKKYSIERDYELIKNYRNDYTGTFICKEKETENIYELRVISYYDAYMKKIINDIFT